MKPSLVSKIILCLLIAIPNIVLGEKDEQISLLCNKGKLPGVDVSAYVKARRGKVVSYVTPAEYKPAPADLVCATIRQFWAHKESFPDKLTLIITNKDFQTSFILQVNRTSNVLLIATAEIPTDTQVLKEGSPAVKTVWLSFPDPLKRITEMIRQSILPLASKGETKANYVTISKRDIMFLIFGHKRETAYQSSGSVILGRPLPLNSKQIINQ